MKTRILVAVGSLAAFAGAALGGPVSGGSGGASHEGGGSFSDMVQVKSITKTRSSADITYTIVGGNIPSVDYFFSGTNAVFITDTAADLGLPSGTTIALTDIGWDVTINAYSPSWLADMTVYWDDSISPDLSGLFVTPGFADTYPGSVFRSSGGLINLAANSIPDVVMPNGQMRWEFAETYDDFAPGTPEGDWALGSEFHFRFSFVPAPGSLALVGIAGLASTRRRR